MDPLQQQTLINNLIATTYDNVLLPYLKKLHSLAKDEIEKIKIDWNQSFKNYLSHSFDKYSRIKTLLFKTEPKYLYDFFESPTLSIKGKFFTTDCVETILNESRFVIIKGEGGIGKSTLLKHLFLNTMKTTELIPIFLELLEFNDSEKTIDITDLLSKKLSNLGCSLERRFLEYALYSGCFVFFLDGYDELTENRRRAFFTAFDQFCDQYSDNHFIMTSRPFSEFIEFQRFTVMTCESLTKEQAKSLITKIHPFDEKLKKRFINDLDNNLYGSHYEFASNPLLLNIMLLTYDNYAEIPAKRHIFYDYAYETMYHRHDATKKGAFKRSFKNDIPSDKFKKILAYFCFISFSEGKILMSKEEVLSFLSKTKKRYDDFNENAFMDDLINSVCLLFIDGLVYRFIHRSFQEYFVALFLRELPDDLLSKVTIQMIRKANGVLFNNDALFMLRDMAKERFEKSIIVPFLKNEERKFDQNASKYDQYFLLLYNSTSRVRYQIASQEEVVVWNFLISIVDPCTQSVELLSDYKNMEKKLRKYVPKSKFASLAVEGLSINDLKKYGVYSAHSNTIIGVFSKTLSELLGQLENDLNHLNDSILDFL